MNLKLLIWPDELLTLRSEPIFPPFDDVKELVKEMFALMYKKRGVGLSAIQVGYQSRLFIMDCSNQPGNLQNNIEPKPLVLINPEITEIIGTPSLVKEGCLSFPGVTEDANRYPEIIIKAQNLEEEFVTYQMAGLEAQCAQHECDHLNGKTFDRGWGKVKRDIVKRKIFKARNGIS